MKHCSFSLSPILFHPLKRLIYIIIMTISIILLIIKIIILIIIKIIILTIIIIIILLSMRSITVEQSYLLYMDDVWYNL